MLTMVKRNYHAVNLFLCNVVGYTFLFIGLAFLEVSRWIMPWEDEEDVS